MRFRASLLIIVLSLSGAVPARAASLLPEPGTRIRLTARTPERERWMGPFVGVLRDTVTVHDADRKGALVAVPTLHVERFEISRGDHASIGRGALAGFVMGALVGTVAGYYATNSTEAPGPGAGATMGAVAFGGLGALLGVAKQAYSPSEQWVSVPLEDLRGATGP
jgi:hypothetical protein